AGLRRRPRPAQPRRHRAARLGAGRSVPAMRRARAPRAGLAAPFVHDGGRPIEDPPPMTADDPRLTDRASYPLWTHDKLRYADTDRQGHINNAKFATFLETGRVAFLYDPTAPLAPQGCEFVIARLVVDFLAELRWPGEVDIGSRILSI